MVDPINRCARFFNTGHIPYSLLPANELESKLNLLKEKYVLMVYSPADDLTTFVTIGGFLHRAICERGCNKLTDQPTNELTLFIKGKREKGLRFTNGDFVQEDSIGILRWVGTIEQFNQLSEQGYFCELVNTAA